VPYDRALRVHTCWDLGKSDSTAIWFVQAAPGKERRLIDYYEASGVEFDHYAKVLDEKKYTYGSHYFPHDVGVNAIGMGRSRVDTLRSLGIEPTYDNNANKVSVLDGINAVRLMLDATWIDAERCARGIEALKAYRREYDDKLKDWKLNPLHDWSSHGADALRTFATQYEEATKPVVFKLGGGGGWMGH
jgi:phage terminase large subunit